MPLAILRRQGANLPVQFTLDDTMAMAPEMKLSAFPRVVIGARVSNPPTRARRRATFRIERADLGRQRARRRDHRYRGPVRVPSPASRDISRRT